ncbi:Ribosomal protein S18 acetylase RimI [Bacillus sp. 491mf]|uniref:GNAT family N-acetyltransferase n=1 Tax=Bacillus sp. 491mf TaxID=1761755 RepID=UPI0008E14B64|nr:GNAT family N-acetyltransferase [Bacillus sp. 491mf]SFC76948.1 Ribosomal protein S18 acetylase RimI [Bacillus sp. 491mf]
MIRKLSPSSIEEATKILEVQIPAYKIEAQYLENNSIPRLYDTITDIQNCNEVFYGYFIDDTLAGFISFLNEDDVVDIHRLVVSPTYFHRGIATALLQHLFQLHEETTNYIVQTGKKNAPAISLYKKYNFIETKEIPLPDGLVLVQLTKLK